MLLIGLDSFSYNLHMEDPEHPRDVAWFLSRFVELGLDGCQLDGRHLQGWDQQVVLSAGDFCRDHGLYINLSTGGFGFEDISSKLKLASRAGARCLRTFHGGHRCRMSADELRAALATAREGLKRLAEPAERNEVVLALENHEEFTSEEIVELLEAVGSPYVRSCLDTGNCLPVREDPITCARNLAPYAACTHLKDWLVSTEAEGVAWEDRPLGQGDARAAEAYEIIRAAQPEMPLTIEVPTWGSRRPVSLADEESNVRQSILFLRGLP